MQATDAPIILDFHIQRAGRGAIMGADGMGDAVGLGHDFVPD
jgi:hypothetical protein